MESFLLSIPYFFMLGLTLVEYVIWSSSGVLSDSSSIVKFISLIGFFISAAGEIIRNLSMHQNKEGFTHDINTEVERKDELCTSGMYRYFRHPAYFGWYLWAVGMQMILVNPLSFVIALLTTFIFMKQRIYFEECHLIKQFGQSYVNYRNNTPIRIPFIKGTTIGSSLVSKQD